MKLHFVDLYLNHLVNYPTLLYLKNFQNAKKYEAYNKNDFMIFSNIIKKYYQSLVFNIILKNTNILNF